MSAQLDLSDSHEGNIQHTKVCLCQMVSSTRRVSQKQPIGSAMSSDESSSVQDYINGTDVLFVIPFVGIEDSRRLAHFSHVSLTWNFSAFPLGFWVKDSLLFQPNLVTYQTNEDLQQEEIHQPWLADDVLLNSFQIPFILQFRKNMLVKKEVEKRPWNIWSQKNI